MANKNKSITNTRVYSDSVNQLRKDAEAWFRTSDKSTHMRLPASLVSIIRKRRDSEVAYKDVVDGVTAVLGDYCFVGKWESGREDDVEFIQFVISKEMVEDEV